MINWQDIQYFAVFARLGSLSAVARDLGVDHVTVGRRIASLESSLGVKLVNRLPRNTILTTSGKQLALLATDLEHAVHAFARRACGAMESENVTVTISAPPAIAAKLIAPHIGAFQQRHSNITLVLSGASEQAALDRGEAEIAVRLFRPKEEGLIARRIGKIRFGLYATQKIASLPETELNFIAYDDKLDQVEQQVWLRSILAGRRIIFRASDLFGQQEAAQASLGAVVLPTFMGDADLKLEKLPTPSEPPERAIWLVTYPDLRRAPAIRSALDFIADIIETQCPK